MKVLGIILAVLMLAGSAFVGVLGANKARDTAHKLSMLTDGMSAEEKAAIEASAEMAIPSTGRLTTGAVVGFLGALAAGALLIATFAKKHAVPTFALVAVAVTGISAVIYPHVPTGPLEGLAPRPQALVAGALALVGAIGALIAVARPARR